MRLVSAENSAVIAQRDVGCDIGRHRSEPASQPVPVLWDGAALQLLEEALERV
jgi:hypothetical protein